jgi:hypothetical protein
MKRLSVFAVMSIAGLALSAMFTACSSSSDAEDMTNVVYNEEGKAGVMPEFVISLPRNVVGGTRMEGDIVQNFGTSDQFRGIDNIRLIPFTAAPTSTSTKLADIIRLSSIKALEKPGSVNYKVYADQFVPVGTKNFLFYGKAVDYNVDEALTSMDDKFRYGILKSTGLTESDFTNAGSVNFTLEQINTSTEQQQNDPVGRAIIQLMSQLANVTVSGVTAPDNAWSTTTHSVLAALYKNFIGTTVYSSNCLALILDKIYFGLDHVGNSDPARPLANRIRSMIQDACVSGYEPVANTPVKLKSDYSGYPANVGLPDGAARCRWNASGLQANMFVDMSANYTLGFRVKPTDYCYPAALWYFISTPVRTSANIESVNYGDQTSWENVINNIYTATNDEVVTGTRSVALADPVQYAVGRLETRVQMESGGTIYDGDGQAVDFGDGYTLKGLLLGGQNSVNFAFESTGNENFCIYDRVMSASNLTFKPGVPTTTPNHTLALETKTNQKIFAALELVNNGQAFKGADGTIPAGGVFYMTVSLDPTTATNYSAANLNKIIMKDHVTKLTVTIKKGSTFADRGINGNPPDGVPDKYVFDPVTGQPIGVDASGHNDGTVDPYDIDGDGTDDTFITDPAHGGPGWDTDGDGEVDIPVLPDPLTGKYPQSPTVPDGLGNATNGVPDLSSPGIELGTSVNLEWQEGLILNPSI